MLEVTHTLPSICIHIVVSFHAFVLNSSPSNSGWLLHCGFIQTNAQQQEVELQKLKKHREWRDSKSEKVWRRCSIKASPACWLTVCWLNVFAERKRKREKWGERGEHCQTSHTLNLYTPLAEDQASRNPLSSQCTPTQFPSLPTSTTSRDLNPSCSAHMRPS